MTKQLLSSLEETLPKTNFIRIHRSFIVAINKIDSYNADSIQIGKTELPIGRLYKKEVNRLLNLSSIAPAEPTPDNHSKDNSANEKKSKT